MNERPLSSLMNCYEAQVIVTQLTTSKRNRQSVTFRKIILSKAEKNCRKTNHDGFKSTCVLE